ncbi:pentatricopeptide repeat-containing protein At3g07290, mitochondrial-like [Aristolochia californica]|uniref:pentatricopeptide repeat-containing protein At3g07290, mitochondrial-like n=1 Tax=Aristolochia californica TaxID=171875 RepID=UPI0035DCA01D
MGTLHVALDMFNKMAACGLNPNKVSYTALIHGCRKREAIGLALSLLDKIKEISCRPNVHTYNVIFNGFCTQNRLPEAEKLCKKIAAQGLFPTVVTYTTLIDGLCKSGATSFAFKVVDEMMKHNCLPNHHTYNTVIYGLCQEVNAMEAELLFKEMQRKGLIPERVTSTSVIDGPYGVLLNGLQKDQHVLEEDHIDGYLSIGKARGSTTVSGLLDSRPPYGDCDDTLVVVEEVVGGIDGGRPMESRLPAVVLEYHYHLVAEEELGWRHPGIQPEGLSSGLSSTNCPKSSGKEESPRVDLSDTKLLGSS